MVFLMVQHRSAGRHLLLVEELAGTLDTRIRFETTRRYLPVLGASRTEEIVGEVTSLAWIGMLESESRRAWAEICFHRFILNLGRDALRKLRQQKTVSLDTDDTARTAVLAVAGQGASPEDMVYLREVLSEMKPRQREAFLMHHVNEPQRAIAQAVGRSDRSVRTWLKQTEHRLQAGF
jgi:RNA polymerase sigma factor (sigma-70 family)